MSEPPLKRAKLESESDHAPKLVDNLDASLLTESTPAGRVHKDLLDAVQIDEKGQSQMLVCTLYG